MANLSSGHLFSAKSGFLFFIFLSLQSELVAFELPSKPAPVLNTYIVAFHENQAVAKKMASIESDSGHKIQHRYNRVFNGIGIELPPHIVRLLQKDPSVRFVEKIVMFDLHVQTIPTGVKRINTEISDIALINGLDERVDVDVAIIDTGVDLDHSDLNVFRTAYCFQQTPVTGTCQENDSRADDAFGHGTHVAGTIGALDNNIGVVGVAPGARLWAIDVTRSDGGISTLEIIAALEYVQTHSAEIEVVNMSLGFVGSSSALDTAIESVTNSGVTIVTSAGNDAIDVANVSPAGNPNVITVSAFADFDGLPGSYNDLAYVYSIASGQCTENVDDSFACFSNYGSGVDLMAPGVKINSTYLNNGYAELHGTSMSSPHVAGAAALYLSANPGKTPAEVKTYLKASGDFTPCGEFGAACVDDPDNVHEPLVLIAHYNDEEIPFLPPWALVVLVAGILGVGARPSRKTI